MYSAKVRRLKVVFQHSVTQHNVMQCIHEFFRNSEKSCILLYATTDAKKAPYGAPQEKQILVFFSNARGEIRAVSTFKQETLW